MNTGNSCGLCQRKGLVLTRHHLVPRMRHGKKSTRREHSRESRQETVLLCRTCHKQIHATLTEKELDREYFTLEALENHPDLAKFLLWIRKQPPGKEVPVRHKRR